MLGDIRIDMEQTAMGLATALQEWPEVEVVAQGGS